MKTKQATLVAEIRDVRWRIPFSDLLRLLIPGVILLLLFFSPQFDRTPFIDTLQDLVRPSSSWLFLTEGHSPLDFGKCFLIGIGYTFALTYFFYQIYFTFSETQKCDEVQDDHATYVRKLHTSWLYLDKKKKWWANLIFLLFLLSSLLELTVIYDKLLDKGYEYFDTTTYLLISRIAFVFRSIGLSLGTYVLLKTFFNDFMQNILLFLKKFLPYFYPSILSIVVLGVVLANMDQMDSLFIDLIRSPWNFLFFSVILFPASLIIIWFVPFYLHFTDHQFEDDREDRDQSIQYLVGDKPSFWRKWRVFKWLYVHKRMLLPVDENKGEAARVAAAPQSYDRGEIISGEPDIASTEKNTVPEVTLSFHLTRLVLGAVYILTLVNISSRIYWSNSGGAIWQYALSILTPLLAFLYIWFAWRQLPDKEKPQYTKRMMFLADTDEQAAPVKPKINWFWQGFTRLEMWIRSLPFAKRVHNRMKYRGSKTDNRPTVSSRWPLLFFFISFLACTILFSITLYLTVVAPSVPNLQSWRTPFASFLAFVVVSLFVFLGIAFYRIFFKNYQFEHNVPSRGFMDAMDYSITSVILRFLPFIALFAFCFFMIGLLWSPFLYSKLIQSFNPLNIYLLLVNGLIAMIVLIDRSLLLWHHVNLHVAGHDTRYIAPKYQIWAVLGLVLLLSQSYCGNSYNEIRYTGEVQTEHEPVPADPRLSLEEYTRRFVDKLESEKGTGAPIMLIGADGGGLKAAYWTMLNLHKLDQEDLFDDHVFMSSGASGGAIGLGIYTYLKSLNISDEMIREKIEIIGSTNFLSGDFTGLLTRFPLRAWPDRLGFTEAHQFDDRMDAMARAYFELCQETRPGAIDFEQFRREPFFKLWDRNPDLPLYVLNTSRSEDGMRGIVHPLRPNANLTTGVVDLSSVESPGQPEKQKFISYPEALFLTNRFPVFSPAGKIQGKGNFIDAGAVENSGLATIYQFLEVMKHQAQRDTLADNPFRRFFQHKIYILSIRNAKSRFIRDKFYPYLNKTNLSFHVSDLSANINAALNSGLVGTPYYWDDRLLNKASQPAVLYDSLLRINLPFLLDKHDPHRFLGGQIGYPGIDTLVTRINTSIYEQIPACNDCPLVMPPLGRLLAEPVRLYMTNMVNHADNEAVFRLLRNSNMVSGISKAETQ